jgi:glycosyltransferase involved in cell wall biosynthesis
MKKNLIIDCQLLQTGAWHRGMGKYTLQLLGELSEHSTKEYNLHLVFNESIGTDSSRYDVINYICPNAIVHKLELPVPQEGGGGQENYREKLSSFIGSRFGGEENLFLITALFMFDYFAEFPSGVQKLLLFYDLTPFMFWKDLGGYFPPNIYMKRFKQILESDLLFAISQTTKDDLVAIFGLKEDSVVNINGGFTKISESPLSPKNFNIKGPFILFPSGDLPHKNNDLAVQGFEEFNKFNNDKFKLLITSSFSKESQTRLKKLSKNLVFTGNVSDEELEWLYEQADIILFSSKYEGLGMPILDAVANGKPIAASDIPVFREMSGEAYNFFNPHSTNSIKEALINALNNKPDKRAYELVMRKYTWQQTRKSFIEGLKNHNDFQQKRVIVPHERVAIVSIYPGIANQIGRTAEPLYRNLSDEYKVDYYFDPLGMAPKDIERPTFLDHIGVSTHHIGSLSPWRYRKYKLIVYLIDDMVTESWITEVASVLPGVVLYNFNDSSTVDRIQTVMANNLTFDISKLSISQVAILLRNMTNKLDRRFVQEDIIRSSWTNRSIIKQLLRDLSHES